MKKYYLAHQFKYRFFVREQELRLEKEYNIILDNPFYDAAKRQDIEIADKGIKRKFSKIDCDEIVGNDLSMIDNADGIVSIIIDDESLGSYMEIFYCSHDLYKPVYLICPVDKIRNHIWIRKFATKRFKNITDFEKWLIKKELKK